MKLTNKYIKTLSLIFLAGGLFSCSEDIMDRINENVDNAKDVEAKYILTDVITSTAFSNIGSDFNHYFSSYIEHEVGVYNQLYNAETRITEVYSSTTFNNVWTNLYSTLKNARIIIDKCSEKGTQPGNYTTKGIAEVMAAINSALITDAFGDTPFSQAALPNLKNGIPQFLNPKIDAQADIYKGIIGYLDAAIEDLPKGDKHLSGEPGAQDLLFEGNAESWLRLAYGLKARYLLHTINRAENQKDILNTIKDCLAKAKDSKGEYMDAAFKIYDGVTNKNPYYDFFDSREYMAASKSMFDKLEERNDPRMQAVYISNLKKDDKQKIYANRISCVGDDKLNPAPNGKPVQKQRNYSTSIFGLASDAPTFLLSKHELLFIEAEVLQRLGDTAAKDVLKKAIIAAMLNTQNNINSALKQTSYPVKENADCVNLSESMAELYFNNFVLPLYNANPLKEIMIQKYIAFWGANGESTECYNDVRRIKAEGHDFYGFQNPGKFPLRAPYGADEVVSNNEVKDAYGDGQYVFTENVWWAGGSR